MKSLVILVVFVGLAYGQVPTPCETPTIWEAREAEVDRADNFERFAKISYDEVNRRIRRIEELDIGSDKDYYDELFLFDEFRMYRLNLRTRQCNVTGLSRPWHPYGIPPEATFDGEAYIGASATNEGVLVTRWTGKFFETDYYVGVFTQPGCVPVLFDTYYSSSKRFVSRTFYDVTLGISDPNKFVPPSECSTV
ncbi:mammalian ependymin-related protein 1-like [Liolophura sinensis]|uniref:mammalian ependymin-related protein 1-like n=1 Tax=Liolophura sinensis TaxID=3198878 RepID=UPI00315892D3